MNVTPVGTAEEIVAALSEGVAELEIIAGAGHFMWRRRTASGRRSSTSSRGVP